MINEEFHLSDAEKQDALNDNEQGLTRDFLFDEKNFQTIIIQKKTEEISESSTNAEQAKINENISRQNIKEELDTQKFVQQYLSDEKNDLLLWLKQNNYKHLLVEKITTIHDKNILKHLLCAYWEAGFDDYRDLMIFIPHLLSDDFDVALEAYTAIIGLSKPFSTEDIQKALQMIHEVRSQLPATHIPLVDEITNLLNTELSNNE